MVNTAVLRAVVRRFGFVRGQAMTAYIHRARRMHRRRLAQLGVVAVAMTLLALGALNAFAVQPGNADFQRTWERTDKPVADSGVARTWMWGDQAFTNVLDEDYQQAPGGIRKVQYFDKSRMEINNPDGDHNTPWYVTNGLLVV